MRTDVSFHAMHPDQPHVILDAKYYAETLISRTFPQGATERIRSAHLYKLYTYLRTQEDLTDAHRNAHGILLYPQTDTPLDVAVTVQGHPIRLATLDLALDWARIYERLLSLLPVPPQEQPDGGSRVVLQ